MTEYSEMGIGVQNDKLVINLGTCIGWIGMSKEDALAFAESIKQHAEEIPDSVGETD
jgi:hypothetical protein